MAGGDYGRIRHTFWTDPDIKRSLTPEQKVLLLYWFSSPHSNMVGLFYCPLEYVALETGLPLDKVREWTLGALSRFVSYDEKTEEVLVHRAAKHQITEHLQATDKRLKAIKRSLAEAHSKPLLRAFLTLYADWPLGIEAPPELKHRRSFTDTSVQLSWTVRKYHTHDQLSNYFEHHSARI